MLRHASSCVTIERVTAPDGAEVFVVSDEGGEFAGMP